MSVTEIEDPFLEFETSLRNERARSIGEFDEAAYLVAFPDIAVAVQRGQWRSALHHYKEYGSEESRLLDARYLRALSGQIVESEIEAAVFPAANVDVAFVTSAGLCLVIGWIDDGGAGLEAVSIVANAQTKGVVRQPARCRRADAEAGLGRAAGQLLGFWALIAVAPEALSGQAASVRLTADGKWRGFPVVVRSLNEAQFRDTAFEYLAATTYCGNPAVEAFFQLDKGSGLQLLRLNGRMSAGIKSHAFAERYGPDRAKYHGSIVVCLYGKSEFLFLQSALFSAGRNAADYEFIYVSNSPELTETLQKEAAIAERVYGLSQTLVFLPGNAGFGAANNVAVQYARSDRILIVNPDVFPRDDGWAERHDAIIGALPPEQTALFGAPLFYDDGSLMHGGMFFEVDRGLSVKSDGIVARDLIRVEHYAKGAPPDLELYQRSRPVPALTGAFISADRTWFEALGGFSEEYVFGHYEDADLCLKSLSRGRPVWLHDLPMWHLEGKGSHRTPAHDGGSLVNRWYFTKTWGPFIAETFATSDPRAARNRTVAL